MLFSVLYIGSFLLIFMSDNKFADNKKGFDICQSLLFLNFILR